MDEELLTKLAKRIEGKYYGKYRGFVLDRADPEQLGRVLVQVPSVLASEPVGWALPCAPVGGLDNQGMFAIPEVGAQLWVEFEEGDIAQPIWTGTFWQPGTVPAEAALDEPTTTLFRTPSGHTVQFDDAEGEEQFSLRHPAGAEMQVDKDGTVAITDAQGAKLTLDAAGGQVIVEDANGNTLTMTSAGTTVEDANGNKIEMAASGINVKGQQIVIEGSQVMLGGAGGEPVIKGQSFLTLFATHVHPTGVGPSGPPIPQGEMSSLSMKVMTA